VIGPTATATATATATTTIAWGTTRTRTFTRTIDVAAIAAGVDQICCGTPARFSNATGKGSAVVAALPLRDLGFGSFGGGRTKNKTGGAGSSSNSSSNPNRPIPCGSAFHPLLNQHGHDPHGHHHRQHGHSHHRRLFSSVFSMPCTGTDFSSGKGTKNGHRRRDATLKVLRVSVENAVRHRLKEDFPREFGVIAVRDDNQERDKQQRELELGGGIHRNNESMSLSSFRTLLALNGFQKVVTPTGTKGRLYLAEGVVATPPRWRTLADEVNNRVAMAFQNAPARDRLFAQPIAISRLHPGDGNENGNGNDNDNDAQNKYKYNSFASSGKGALSASASASSTAASSPQQFSLSVALPEFVQDDLTWYRLAENSAAKFLDRRYSSWKDWTEKRFVLPLRNAKYRTRVMLKTIHKVHQKIHAVLEKSILERCLETIRGKSSSSNDNNNNNNNSNNNSKGCDQGIERANGEIVISNSTAEAASVNVSEPINEMDPNSGNANKNAKNADIDDDPLENLMVISSRSKLKKNQKVYSPNQTTSIDRGKFASDDNSYSYNNDDDDDDEVIVSATLYRRMTRSTRILALPDYYVLRHSSASTLVSVSLIVFGALPMAYRSYVFTIDYEWLIDSSVIASSVIATVLYYSYAARWKARTSQSNTVAKALCARVYARDDAALLALREGAVRSVTGSGLREIISGNIGNGGGDGNDDDGCNCSNSDSDSGNGAVGGGVVTTNNIPVALVDPKEWAIDYFRIAADVDGAATAKQLDKERNERN